MPPKPRIVSDEACIIQNSGYPGPVGLYIVIDPPRVCNGRPPGPRIEALPFNTVFSMSTRINWLITINSQAIEHHCTRITFDLSECVGPLLKT